MAPRHRAARAGPAPALRRLRGPGAGSAAGPGRAGPGRARQGRRSGRGALSGTRGAPERARVKFAPLRGGFLGAPSSQRLGRCWESHPCSLRYPPSDSDLSEFVRDMDPREPSETHLGLSLEKDFDGSQV